MNLKVLIPFLCALMALQTACRKRSFGADNSETESLLDPHRLPERGPWFEGWYLRITPVDANQRTLGVIVGSYLPRGSSRKELESTGLPGYASILDGGVSGSALRSFEVFPNATQMFLDRDRIVDRDPAPKTNASFRWTAAGVGELTERGTQIALPNGASLNVQLFDVSPWNSSGLGPEGYISLFRAFPLHWFVYSLKSLARYTATFPETPGFAAATVSGIGYAHFEKNWGVSFPPAYVWMQAHDAKQNRSVAIAGGRPLELGPAKPEAWLVGFRSEKNQIDFAPQNIGTVFQSQVDACQGKFELTSSFLNRRLRISASADRKTFGGIAIPNESGFEKNGSEQSFQTRIIARLYEVTPFAPTGGQEKLLEETEFENGALEFGSDFKCKK